jgi:arylsulfatase A-like enzyme
MRIIYFDIDTLRMDHLTCYGYRRQTSPTIDQIAREGVRYTNCYTSDAPCLPSRTALLSGRFGIHNGVVGHGGTAADLFIEGKNRWFSSTLGETSWMSRFRKNGYRTVSVSSFGERHSAWQWYANFSEIFNPGQRGEEKADEIYPIAKRWIEQNGLSDNWFLHINFWDPHTPYRTPNEFGEPFAKETLPEWLNEEVRKQHWAGCGSWSAQEGMGYGGPHPYVGPQYPRQPNQISSMDEVRRMFDGYDTGILYADHYIGRLVDLLKQLKIYEETAIIISADHGETLGELNIYYDHQTADKHVTNVPLIIRWPGLTDDKAGTKDDSLRYQFDFAATLIEVIGEVIPENWDGRSFLKDITSDEKTGRDYLVISQGAHTCQRSVRFKNYICIRSYHDGFHNFPDIMLFDLEKDPHEQHDLASDQPILVNEGMKYLTDWQSHMMRSATHARDPLWHVLMEGGPLHTRDNVSTYIRRLIRTGREDQAKILLLKHPEVKVKKSPPDKEEETYDIPDIV